MTTVQMDNDIHRRIKSHIKKNKYDYPSVKSFLDKACHEKLEAEGAEEVEEEVEFPL